MKVNWSTGKRHSPAVPAFGGRFVENQAVSTPLPILTFGRGRLIAVSLPLLLFLIPVINAFRSAPEYVFNSDFSLSRYLNFISLGIAFVLVLLMRSGFSKRLFTVLVAFFFVLTLNYFFTDYASRKWFLNWVGFLFIFGAIYNAFLRMDVVALKIFNRLSGRLLILCIFLVALAFLYVWIINFRSLFWFFQSAMTNHVIALHTYSVGIEKQALGSLGAIFILFLIFFRSNLPKYHLFILWLSFILIAPALIGVRTLILGLGLFGLFAIILKSQTRFVLWSALAGVPLCLYLVLDWKSVTVVVSELYDRWNSLLAAVNAAIDNPLGLGNGGYHVYVERYNDVLVANFGSEKMLKTGAFWQAPESDLVYFIASWGVLSLVFFSIMGYVIYMSIRLIRRRGSRVAPIEKMILAFTSVLFLMGISQDNAGGLLWWIYFGASMGIIERYRRQLFSRQSRQAPVETVVS